jgi:hypothetical protein
LNKYLKKSLLLIIVLLATIGLVACDDLEPGVDRIAPVFSGLVDIEYTIGDELPDFLEGVSANDRVDGIVTSSITVDTSEVNFNEPGEYEVTYRVSDAAGNERVATITITVVEGDVPDLSNEDNALLDIENLSWEPGQSFPTSGENGTSFAWTSGNPLVITNRGYVMHPAIGSEPVTVTMNVTASNGSFSTTVGYDVVVEPRLESVVTSKVALEFYSTSEEWNVLSQEAVDVYFVDNGTVPYMDVETFLMMVSGALDSDILVFEYNEDILVVSYSVEYEDFDGTMIEEELFMTIDFTANTVTVDTFSFFSYYITSTETDFGEGLVYVDAEYREPQTVVIDLNHYRFDLVIDTTDDAYLMPLHVANLIFLGRAYYDVYYNGDKLIGFDTFSRNDQEVISQLRASSLNGVSPARDLREATFHFMALSFDYFYGLKNDRGVDTYYNFLAPYADDIIMRTNTTMYNTLFEIANKLDDLHTSHGFPGYHASSSLNPTVSQLAQLGPRVQQWYQGLWAVQDLLEAQLGTYTDLPSVRLIDEERTAIIYIGGFTVDTPGEFKRTMDDLPATVENVVIDLSYNTGGNLGAVLRIFGYMTDQGIQYHSQNPADGSAVTYFIESEYVPYNYNWFIRTSSVTFSAANLMASIAKEMGIATIVGQKSSGGASSIGIIITPVGTSIIMSTNNVLSTRVGDDYLSIENGIEVDYFMLDITDEELLISIINEVNGNR